MDAQQWYTACTSLTFNITGGVCGCRHNTYTTQHKHMAILDTAWRLYDIPCSKGPHIVLYTWKPRTSPDGPPKEPTVSTWALIMEVMAPYLAPEDAASGAGTGCTSL